MADRFKALPTWAQYSLAIFAILVVIGAASGGGSEDADDDSPAASTTSPPAETREASGGNAPEPAPAPEPPDTGRMSEGEFEEFRADAADFREEARVYVDLLSSECAFLLSGGDVKAFVDCEEDAFDGVIGSYAVADENWTERDADVAKKCRVRLKAAVEGLNNYADALTGTHNLAKRGQIDSELTGAVAGELIGRRLVSFNKRVDTVERDCAPK